MIQIAICDDERESVALHEKIVKTSLQKLGIGYEITTYTKSSNLLCDITDRKTIRRGVFPPLLRMPQS